MKMSLEDTNNHQDMEFHYDNPAFEQSEDETPFKRFLNGSKLRREFTGSVKRNPNFLGASLPISDISGRKRSIVDIVIAVKPEISLKRTPSLLPQVTRFIHPYGNVPSVNELLDLEDGDQDELRLSDSLAKYVIWVIMTLFMLGVAGGVILGAMNHVSS